MIVVVAPEPARWLAPLIAELAAGDAPIAIFAPWAHASPPPRWLPSIARRALARRQLCVHGARTIAMPGWLAVDAAIRAWERDDVGRRMTARFALRHVIDLLAARWLPAETTALYAPSCGAERAFAAAAARGIATTLVEDLPSMRRLHADLDRAAAVHPDCRFLRRFRAPAAAIARQEVERVLAGRMLVRGAYARAILVDAGIAAARIGVLPDRAPVLAASRPASARGRRVLLCGLATARGGSHEALAMLADDPSLTLLVRVGEGTEPRDLLAHAGVVRASAAERDQLAGIDAVLAPAWCESYPAELALAAALGIPILATRAACGFTAPTVELAPGEVPRLPAAARDEREQRRG